MATSHTPLPSILKSSPMNKRKSLSTPNSVRFNSTPISKGPADIPTVLKDYIEDRNTANYLKLLHLKAKPDVNDETLHFLLEQVNSCISLLVPKVERFVDALLSVPWVNRPAEIVKNYQNFLHNLLSAHTYYCKTVVKVLVQNFSILDPKEEASQHVHDVVKGILALIPLSQNIVLDSLNAGLPYVGLPCQTQVNYIQNLLKFMDYCPMSGSLIYNIIVGRLVQLDSWVTREEFLETSTTLEQMDLDDEKEDSDSTKAAQTMDVMMCTMLELCSDKFRDGQTFETQRVLYQQVYSAFESLILPAFGIHHAHFLMFYVCSKKPTFHESFVERLWAVFQNPSSPLNIRKASADYLASFLGKASFVPIKTVIFCLERVCQWIHGYLDRQLKGEGAALFKIRAHAAFYAACHIPFYVVAARFSELSGNKKLLGSLQALDLNRIVSSPLNPLRYCHASTVRHFAESASLLQVVFCHTIIIRNQRLCLPESSSDALVLETEYPFDKYQLPKSSQYVTDLLIHRPVVKRENPLSFDAMEEDMLLSESPRLSTSGTGSVYMHHFLG